MCKLSVVCDNELNYYIIIVYVKMLLLGSYLYEIWFRYKFNLICILFIENFYISLNDVFVGIIYLYG